MLDRMKRLKKKNDFFPGLRKDSVIIYFCNCAIERSFPMDYLLPVAGGRPVHSPNCEMRTRQRRDIASAKLITDLAEPKI